MDILSVRDEAARVNVVVDKLSKNALLATLRVSQPGLTRIEVKLRTSEGQLGNLQVFVVAAGRPVTQTLEVELKPLNLHQRVNKIEDAVLEELPLSKITIAGRFSLADAQLWLQACLPDFPQHREAGSTDYFTSCFVGTHLLVTLSEGAITLQSDNLSAIIIVKEQIAQRAT